MNQREPSRRIPRTATQWFVSVWFALLSSPYVEGSTPAYLDHVRTMGAQDVDLTLSKTFVLHKEKTFQVHVSSFNVENRPQFGAPSFPSIQNVVSDPATYGPQFGVINSTVNTPRQFQFAGRFTF